MCTSVVPGDGAVHPVLRVRRYLGKNRVCVHGGVQDGLCLQEGKHVGKEEEVLGTGGAGGSWCPRGVNGAP